MATFPASRAFLAWIGLLTAAACEPECARLDLLGAFASARPDSPPADPDRILSAASGGVIVETGRMDPVLEPLASHLIAGTSTTAGVVRWTILFRDRALLVEHPLPLAEDQEIAVEELLADVRFTGGGQGSSTWWDTDWDYRVGAGGRRARC
ncbi:MAG: hypothetical protein HC923_06545 [Myxococcales bacterium]|nr:hypothetical protein [Myxococcales bacterium]